MALKLNDGRYVKLNLNNCYANISGMYVSYEQYSTENQRIVEKQRIEEFKKFVDVVYADINKIRAYLENYLREHNIENEDQLKNLPQEILEKIKLIETVDYDLSLIQEEMYKIYGKEERTIKDLKNYNYLKSLGFNEIWIEDKMENPTNITSKSSAYLGQKFTQSEMYNELKKVFKKDGYIDC